MINRSINTTNDILIPWSMRLFSTSHPNGMAMRILDTLETIIWLGVDFSPFPFEHFLSFNDFQLISFAPRIIHDKPIIHQGFSIVTTRSACKKIVSKGMCLSVFFAPLLLNNDVPLTFFSCSKPIEF